MKKQSKIILVLAILAVAYGLVQFFILPQKDKGLKTKKLITKPNKITTDFAMDSLSKISIIQAQRKKNHWKILKTKIESQWEHDPFVFSLGPDKLEEESSLSSPFSRFIYSGYMNVGKISFAVINGKEYKIGETIREYEYKVIKITPKKVILQKNSDQAVIFLKEE